VLAGALVVVLLVRSPESATVRAQA
jgi:hypothetical protein